jgi:hypothetical protein
MPKQREVEMTVVRLLDSSAKEVLKHELVRALASIRNRTP